MGIVSLTIIITTTFIKKSPKENYDRNEMDFKPLLCTVSRTFCFIFRYKFIY